MDTSTIIILVGGFVSSLFMWLLSKKDENQQAQLNGLQKQIVDLYIKHEDDSKQLQMLELEVAKNYNSKGEVQLLLSELKKNMDDNFAQLKQLITIFTDRQ